MRSEKILIVTDFYTPENAIVAVRPTKIAKYINHYDDYEVTVITEKLYENIKDLESEKDSKGIDVIRIGSWRITY